MERGGRGGEVGVLRYSRVILAQDRRAASRAPSLSRVESDPAWDDPGQPPLTIVSDMMGSLPSSVQVPTRRRHRAIRRQ